MAEQVPQSLGVISCRLNPVINEKNAPSLDSNHLCGPQNHLCFAPVGEDAFCAGHLELMDQLCIGFNYIRWPFYSL
jgi:hypothetical protein